MTRTSSTMLELGTPAPGLRLPDFDGRAHALGGEQRPSLGCNIKWKPGNAPDYFAG